MMDEKQLQSFERYSNMLRLTGNFGVPNMLDVMIAEIRRLAATLADYKRDAETAMSETCGDERHCTCVPALRAEVKRLTAENARLREVVEWYGDDENWKNEYNKNWPVTKMIDAVIETPAIKDHGARARKALGRE